jgi:hypothetical protein
MSPVDRLITRSAASPIAPGLRAREPQRGARPRSAVRPRRKMQAEARFPPRDAGVQPGLTPSGAVSGRMATKLRPPDRDRVASDWTSAIMRNTSATTWSSGQSAAASARTCIHMRIKGHRHECGYQTAPGERRRNRSVVAIEHFAWTTRFCDLNCGHGCAVHSAHGRTGAHA